MKTVRNLLISVQESAQIHSVFVMINGLRQFVSKQKSSNIHQIIITIMLMANSQKSSVKKLAITKFSSQIQALKQMNVLSSSLVNIASTNTARADIILLR